MKDIALLVVWAGERHRSPASQAVLTLSSLWVPPSWCRRLRRASHAKFAVNKEIQLRSIYLQRLPLDTILTKLAEEILVFSRKGTTLKQYALTQEFKSAQVVFKKKSVCDNIYKKGIVLFGEQHGPFMPPPCHRAHEPNLPLVLSRAEVSTIFEKSKLKVYKMKGDHSWAISYPHQREKFAHPHRGRNTYRSIIASTKLFIFYFYDSNRVEKSGESHPRLLKTWPGIKKSILGLIWLVNSTHKPGFIFFNPSGNIASRLDRFYIDVDIRKSFQNAYTCSFCWP